MAAALVLGLAGASVTGSPARASHDELTIGISQFPSSLHPYIEAEDVKLYVLGFVTPRVTGYGEGAKLSCLLCTQVPTVQNGLAKIEDRADGSEGNGGDARAHARAQMGRWRARDGEGHRVYGPRGGGSEVRIFPAQGLGEDRQGRDRR